MPYENQHSSAEKIVENLERIRRFEGTPAEFWPAFLEWSCGVSEAGMGVLLVKTKQDAAWKTLAFWPAEGRRALRSANVKAKIEAAAEAAVDRGYTHTDVGAIGGSYSNGAVIAARLQMEEGDPVSAVVFMLEKDRRDKAEDAAMRLVLIADTPAVYQLVRLVQKAKTDVIQFSDALDFTVLLNDEKRFIAAAMTFCNELAARFQCQRVSLGWLDGNYVRVKAISHMEKFEKKMDAVQNLEAAMEETLDQDQVDGGLIQLLQQFVQLRLPG